MRTSQTHHVGDPPTSMRPISARLFLALQIGQHTIAALLIVSGALRAITRGQSVPAVLAAGAALAAWYGIGLALTATWRSRSAATWWLIGFALVWVIALAVSDEFVWVAFVLWLLAGHLLRGWWSVVLCLTVFGFVVAAPLVHRGSVSYADVFGPLIGGIFAFGIARGYLALTDQAAERERLVASLTQAQHDMAAMQDELARAQRESGALSERTRISRDLHDTVAQGLSSVRLVALAAGEQPGDDQARALGQIEALAQTSLADVRRIVAALAPAELENDALAGALGRMLESLGEATGIHTQLRVEGAPLALTTTAEVALLRTAQSALANVRQHAHASRVVVTLADAEEAVRLDIVDDGSGFDSRAWAASAPRESDTGFGLRFMRSRLRENGGDLVVESAPGEGTALSASLPLSGPVEVGQR